jgi:lipoprotein-releasing system ATP-binding protein
VDSLILEALNIHKSYGDANSKLHVLKGVDLTITPGEFLTIIGPSGAGKSTLLHILGGLDVPDQGTVSIEGQDIYRLKDDQRARLRNEKIGFVFQFYHLLPEFTAWENVALPMIVKEDYRDIKRSKDQALALLGRVGLSARAMHKPQQLSGGEQQRVAIARALINQPRMIVCDEPTGNLDSASGQEVLRLLMTLNQENHQTLVVVTHDERIAEVSHRSIHMRDGSLVSATVKQEQ